MKIDPIVRLVACTAWLWSCAPQTENTQNAGNTPVAPPTRIPVVFDTDANNELDDQHAMAYLFFNGETFDVRGVTVNATPSGGEIGLHYTEAQRIIRLCGVAGRVPLYSGADGGFEAIVGSLNDDDYDGKEAVEFIIAEARQPREQPLVLLPVGKLTNIALALKKAPDIASRVTIVWLGSNYPEKGEYNLGNDIAALNYVLDQEVPFEMVTVRYGRETGSDAVKATFSDIQQKMPGVGPGSEAVTGRHGGEFTRFGDYSVDLFTHAQMYGDPPSRALFDMVAVAILKNKDWGEAQVIPAPTMIDELWQERPNNPRKITIWGNFDRESLMQDFYAVM
ncbi:MAG: nucleoside hydrolase, partial [Cyclobacteriaceae bacterium]|nr:nucleoside hydrolase [Cyclobacteriaceae bacterium]